MRLSEKGCQANHRQGRVFSKLEEDIINIYFLLRLKNLAEDLNISCARLSNPLLSLNFFEWTEEWNRTAEKKLNYTI